MNIKKIMARIIIGLVVLLVVSFYYNITTPTEPVAKIVYLAQDMSNAYWADTNRVATYSDTLVINKIQHFSPVENALRLVNTSYRGDWLGEEITYAYQGCVYYTLQHDSTTVDTLCYQLVTCEAQ